MKSKLNVKQSYGRNLKLQQYGAGEGGEILHVQVQDLMKAKLNEENCCDEKCE